jgi:hypothetical protein
MADSDLFPEEPLKKIRPPEATLGANSEGEFPPSKYEEYDLELRSEDVRNAKNNNKLREELPDRLWWLTIAWLGAVVVIMVFSGIQHDTFPGFFFLKYDPSVLIALITSATASVLGLLIILLNYLYPKNGPSFLPSGENSQNRKK